MVFTMAPANYSEEAIVSALRKLTFIEPPISKFPDWVSDLGKEKGLGVIKSASPINNKALTTIMKTGFNPMGLLIGPNGVNLENIIAKSGIKRKVFLGSIENILYVCSPDKALNPHSADMKKLLNNIANAIYKAVLNTKRLMPIEQKVDAMFSFEDEPAAEVLASEPEEPEDPVSEESYSVFAGPESPQSSEWCTPQQSPQSSTLSYMSPEYFPAMSPEYLPPVSPELCSSPYIITEDFSRNLPPPKLEVEGYWWSTQFHYRMFLNTEMFVPPPWWKPIYNGRWEYLGVCVFPPPGYYSCPYWDFLCSQASIYI